MREAAHIAIVEGNRMLMAVRADGTLGFIGGKKETSDTDLNQALSREFLEEIGMKLPHTLQRYTTEVMSSPVSRSLKCTLFLSRTPVKMYIAHIMNIFKPNDELCGLISVDIRPDNQKNILKMRLANGVKEQLEVLFKHVL